jgi:hypothetical protein
MGLCPHISLERILVYTVLVYTEFTVVVIAHCAMFENKYRSIILTKILGMCFWTNILQNGNLILPHCCNTRCHNQGFSTKVFA